MKNIIFHFFTVACLLGHGKSLELQDEVEMSINGSTSNENLANRIQEFYYAKNATERNQWSCNICRLVANKGISLQQLGGDKKQICKFASDMCDLFLPNDALQCNRYVDNLIDSWMYIVENKPEIKAESVCRIRMQDKNCFPDSEVNWEINIPKGESRALSTVDIYKYFSLFSDISTLGSKQ
uniref:Saposin B-type domain-containing protein n=3 Tax=Photinus pyralis TaxID=7054 RepID=A0A1Y1LFE1_PHOPY